MDRELKIAVARPAFKTKDSLLQKVDLIEKPDTYFKRKRPKKLKTTTQSTTTAADPSAAQYANYDAQASTDYTNYEDQYYEV